MIRVEINNGLNEFDIVSLNNCSIIKFKNKPRIMVWEMNWNTLQHFFIGNKFYDNFLDLKHYQSLENKINLGKINFKNIEEFVTPILRLFSNGIYEIDIKQISDYFDVITPGESTIIRNGEVELFYNDWVGGSQFLYKIQDTCELQTVENYKHLIQSNIFPQILIIKTNDNNNYFLLDGHHKLTAYFELGIKPYCILINKATNYSISSDEVLRSFDRLKNTKNTHLNEPLNNFLLGLQTNKNK